MNKEQIPLNDYITRIIHFHAEDEIIKRGIRIYRSGNVQPEFFNEKDDVFRFKVTGNHTYDVKINNLLARNVKTSCSCPYDWGGICKHTVAALKYLAKNDFRNFYMAKIETVTAVEKAPVLRTKDGFEIADYRVITEDFVRKNYHSQDFFLYQHDYLEVKKFKFTRSKITLSMFLHDRSFTIYVTLKNGKVYISSNNGQKTGELDYFEALALLYIAKSKNPDLLDIIFSGYVYDEQNRTLESYGLENEKYEDYFYTSFSSEGLYSLTNERADGLLPVEDLKGAFLFDLVGKINKVADKLDVVEAEAAREKRALGFVIEYNQIDDGYNLSEENYIRPFIAKPNKAGSALISFFEYYENIIDISKYDLSVSDNATALIKVCNVLNQNGFDDDSLRKLYRLQRRAVELLKNEKFVYRKTEGDSGYKLHKKDLQPIKVSAEPLDVFFEVTSDDRFIHLDLKIKAGKEFIARENLETTGDNQYLYFIDDILYTVQSFNAGNYLSNLTDNHKMVKSHKALFYTEIIKPLAKNIEVIFNTDEYDHETVELDFREKQVFLSEKEGYIVIVPQVEYKNGMAAALYHTGDVLSEENGKIIKYRRNFELEDDFVDFISSLHPEFEGQKGDKVFYLSYEDFAKDLWFYKFFDELRKNEIEIFGLKELKNFKYSPHRGKISTSVKSGIDWFEVEMDITFGDNKVSLKDIRNAVINKEKYIRLKDGSVGILPSEWLHKLERYFRHGEVRGDRLSVSHLKFSVIDELFDDISDTEVLQEIEEKKRKLATFKEIAKTKIPKTIKAELRHYQKEGVNWLNFLDEMAWGGILADDMGLGKTLQVLAFLQQIVKKDKTPSLIVVPTTLLFNWEAEIKKFAPGFKALYHYGIGRATDTQMFQKYPLIFTTYGILLRDIEMLKDFRFNYVILDESQAIKNPASRRFKAAGLLNAKNRLALTGTPIENSTFDLYSQMSFVNRGFFGSMNAFKKNFSNPIDKESNEMIATELQRMINPFILRRTKEMVATELPSKTENVIYCEMDKEQREVYDAYRNEFRNKLLGNIEKEGIGKSKMMVLEALTRLRQICDSPLLLNNDEINVSESVKIKEIVRHITDKTANHKLLIFSQFVKMLGLIKSELNKHNIEYEYLDGQRSTKQREQSVKNFQENPDLRVFLISLKAGGTGINLTAADYVYVVDPWWNPAVENQAIDRCYRIGQDKKVFAYRMICTNTVEEKILKLQQKKTKIATDIVQTDESIMKNLSVNDIESLFA
ncbi:MAG: hypothetical protein IEMM0006_2188 [bacterium]|nr:MAG: hypothetical protein IEMM0006_2188 [bacterium]